MATGITPEALLAEASWLRRLAATLAGDADDADDLVQESWIAAWRRNPEMSRSLRPWLAKVLRDQSRMQRRANARRVEREAAAPGVAEQGAQPELLDQVRLHRRLVDLVLELEEPFRSTVLRRFVEGETSASIAKQLDVPESTVRWRLREALARLRTRLDEVNGNRKAWAPAVLAFGEKGVAVARTSKAIAFVVALIALLLSGGAVWLALRADDRSAGTTTNASANPPARDASAATQWKSEALAELKANQRPPGWFAQEGVKRRRVSGTVIADGTPASGAVVRLEDEATQAGLVAAREMRTGADGRFDFGVQVATHYEIGAYMRGRVATVKHIDLRDPRLSSENVVVVVEPCIVGLYGKVTDASGGPIPHAQLLAQGVIGIESDASGSFDICVEAQSNTPEDRRLVIRAAGYGTVELIASLAGRVRHDFTLSPEATISGRVLDAHGEGVALANVRLSWDEAAPRPGSEHPGLARAATDANGRFDLAGVAAGRLRIQAFARGAASAPTTIDVATGGSKEVQLVLRERGVLRGRVVAGGRPVPGVSVYDRAELPTYQPRGQITSVINEAVSQEDGTFVLDDLSPGTVSLGASPYRLVSPLTVRIAPGEQSLDLEVEELGSLTGIVRRGGVSIPHAWVAASGTKWSNKRSTETDEGGRFVIEGLDADDYRIAAASATIGAFVDLETKVRVSKGMRATLDIELRSGARISGRVVDKNTAPVVGAFVRFHRVDGDDLGLCTTDTAGHFSCASMTGAGSYRVEVSASEASPRPYDFVGAPPAPIALRDGDAHVEDVQLAVDARSLMIKGLVVDRDGQAIADVRVLADSGFSPFSSVPTTLTNIRGEFEVRDLAPGAYRLQALGVDGGKAEMEAVAAGTADVRIVLDPSSCNAIDAKLGSVLHEAPTSIVNRPATRVVWDERIELLGWETPARVHAGDSIPIVLIYRALKPVDRSWKIFIHIDGPKMRINGDHEPLGGRCPTSTWRAGDVIVDRSTAHVDPTLDAGNYDVSIGFFGGWAPNWKNLALTDPPASMRGEYENYKLTSVQVEK